MYTKSTDWETASRKKVFWQRGLGGIALLLCVLQSQAWAQICVTPTVVNESMGGTTLNAVAYHNGRYLVVGDGGLVMTSTDGSTWSTLSSGTTDDLVDVVWAGDRFTIFADPGTAAMNLISYDDTNGLYTYSPDPLSDGTAHRLGFDGTNLIIGYYSGVLDTGRIEFTTDYTSTNNSVWDDITHCGIISDIDHHNGVTVYGARCFFDLFFFPGQLCYTLDGSTLDCESTGSGDTEYAYAVATNGTIATARSIFAFNDPMETHYWAHTDDLGTTPLSYTMLADTDIRAALWDADWTGSLFVGAGFDGRLSYSVDGLNWTEVATTTTAKLNMIVPTANGDFVAVGEDETIIVGVVGNLFEALPGWPLSTVLDLVDFINLCP